MKIETVLCPIDFSTLSDFELELAVEVCQAFGAHLVLHHNLTAAAPGLHKAWEWEESHQNKPEEVTEPEAHQNMEKILGRIPQAVHAEARISRGPVGLVLLYLIQEISADLVILGSHGWAAWRRRSYAKRRVRCSPFRKGLATRGRSACRPARALHGSWCRRISPNPAPPRWPTPSSWRDGRRSTCTCCTSPPPARLK